MSSLLRNRVVVGGEMRFRAWHKPLRELAYHTLRFLTSRGSLALFLVQDDVMKKNVLAFPSVEGFPRPAMPNPFLGEVYVNPDYVRRHGESLDYMVIHGVLHLAGYVHETTRDRIRMERIEEKILKFLRSRTSA